MTKICRFCRCHNSHFTLVIVYTGNTLKQNMLSIQFQTCACNYKVFYSSMNLTDVTLKYPTKMKTPFSVVWSPIFLYTSLWNIILLLLLLYITVTIWSVPVYFIDLSFSILASSSDFRMQCIWLKILVHSSDCSSNGKSSDSYVTHCGFNSHTKKIFFQIKTTIVSVFWRTHKVVLISLLLKFVFAQCFIFFHKWFSHIWVYHLS